MRHCILLSPFSGRLTEEEKAELWEKMTLGYRNLGGVGDPDETVYELVLAREERAKARIFADYRDDCLRELLRKGYAPFATHAIYPQVLDDSVPEERKRGMEAGRAFYSALWQSRVFIGDDHGISTEIGNDIEYLESFNTLGTDLRFRSRGEWPE